MKSSKNHDDPAIWIQLADKIKDADRNKKKSTIKLQNEIDSILGQKDLKVIVPKNSEALNSFKTKV